MKNFRFFPLILLSALVFFASCRTSYVIPIEIQKAGSIVIPAKVDGLLVVNNAVPQPGSHVVSLKINNKEKNMTHEIEMDTTLWATVVHVADTISSANFFEKTSVFQEITRDRNDNEWLATIPLSKEKCDSLYEESGCNVILSIDRLFFSMAYDVSNNDGQNWRTESFLKTKCIGVLSASIYLKSRDKKLTSFNIKDSLLNINILDDTVRIFKEIPTLIVRELAGILSEKLASYFIPDWLLTERILYTSSDSRMRKADKYFNKKEWDEARIIWEDLFYEKEKNTDINRARMAMNIGTAYEMNDNLTMAAFWIQKAKSIYSNIAVELPKNEKAKATEYLLALNSRIQDNRILDHQYQ